MPSFRVLIVDDQRDIRRLLRAGMEAVSPDIKVFDVPSGEEAILVISRQPIDLLVVDVRLPGISGLELKERAQVRNPEMKFIFVTGMQDARTRRQVEDAGAEAFFFKPLELPDFLQVVQRCMANLGVQTAPVLPVSYLQPESGDAPLTLAECLSKARGQARALCALLIDEQGQVMAQAGDLPSGMHEDALLPALGSALGAAERFSRLQETAPSEDWFFSAGKQASLCLRLVRPGLGLLLAGSAQNSREALQLLLPAATTAAAQLSVILDQMRQAEDAAPEEPLPLAEPAPASEREPEKAEDLAGLESLLQKAAGQQLKAEEVDAFWDSLSSQSADEVIRADAISYEQALRLGLAPEDGAV